MEVAVVDGLRRAKAAVAAIDPALRASISPPRPPHGGGPRFARFLVFGALTYQHCG